MPRPGIQPPQDLAGPGIDEATAVIVPPTLDSVVDLQPRPVRIDVEELLSIPDPEFTDLSAALRLAGGVFPEGMRRRLVLFSDGNENLAWFENLGGGLAWTVHAIESGIFVRNAHAADIDGNGVADVVVSREGALSWFRNSAGEDLYDHDARFIEGQLQWEPNDSFEAWLKYTTWTFDNTSRPTLDISPYNQDLPRFPLVPSPWRDYPVPNPTVRDLHQVHQFALELAVLVPQHLDLVLYQRYGGTAAVRNFQAGQQAGVVLEEFRVFAEIVGDGLFIQRQRIRPGLLRCGHRSICPW